MWGRGAVRDSRLGMITPPNRKDMRTSRKAEMLASTRARERAAIARNWETLTEWQRKFISRNRKNLQGSRQSAKTLRVGSLTAVIAK